MEHQVIALAIAKVRTSGEDVTAYRVYKSLMASGHRHVSYQEVHEQLITLGVLAADDEARDAPPHDLGVQTYGASDKRARARRRRESL